MPRGQLFRGWGRRSYKASEVVGLFVLSIFAGMIISGVAVAIDFLLRTFFGRG
jgi:hypothetical protein